MNTHSRVVTDARGVVLDVEPSFTGILGWAPGQVVGRRLGELVHPEDLKHGLRTWTHVLRRPEARTSPVRIRCRHLDGGWVWMDVSYRNALESRGAVLVDMVDVRHEVELSQRLDVREQLLTQLGELAGAGAFHADLAGRVLYASRRLEEMTRVRAAASLAEQLAPVPVSERPRLTAAVQRAAGGERTVLSVETSAGRWHISVWPVVVATGTVSGVTGCIEDDALADGSTSAFAYDPLTGALTRETTMRALVDLARREVLAPPGAIPAETRRREDTLGIACIVVRLGALDPFTAQHGPDARDELLSLVALRVRDSVRSSDILGRTAEDELAVLCARVPGPTAALSIARAILSQLSEPMTLSSGLTLTLRPGIGVGWSQPSTAQPEHMLAKAQRAAVESASSASPEPLLSTLYAQHHGPAGSGSPPDPAAVGSPSAASGPYG